jgi:hypothetical protein
MSRLSKYGRRTQSRTLAFLAIFKKKVPKEKAFVRV